MDHTAAAARATPAGAEPVLEARGLEKRYGERTALAGVSLAASRGEVVAVIGPNGAGKTTLLSILAGIVRPDDGDVSLPPRAVGWVPQQAGLYGKLTVRENLELFARLEEVAEPDVAVERMLELSGLGDRAGEEVSRLSGGNRQRVNIAIGLLADPPMLLLDEPSAALDPRQRERLWEFLHKLATGGTAVIYATHNILEADRHADRVMVLAEGEVLFAGPPPELEKVAGLQGTDFEAAFVEFLAQKGH